jgi:NAD(P)-dependent dehydrogenase (short-subunit alcohol dehydrogenase family)
MRILITGAASGIGLALAALVAGKSADRAQLMLVDLDEARLRQAAESLQGTGAKIVTRAADLSEPEAPARVVEEAGRQFGGLDGIASNAGIIQSAPLTSLEVREFDRIFCINARAAWLLGKAAHPLLKQSRGALVATASVSAEHPTPPLGAYSASKAALVMLVQQMAVEWGPDGIRCNCVSPGPTLTPMTAVAYSDPKLKQQRENNIPLRRLGRPEDIANAIAFLMSPEGAYISGVNLMVDGGMSQCLMPATGSGGGH